MPEEMNPNKPKRLKRLLDAAEWSREKLAFARRTRVEMIRQFVGRHYGEGGADDKVPVNFLAMAVIIYTRQLAANTPKVQAVTGVRELKPQAKKFTVGLNYVLREIEFKKSMRQVVTDAMFTVGIHKVGLVYPEMDEIDGFLHDAGQPFADCVAFDDWVHDMAAKRFESCQFMGDRYTLPLDVILDPSSPYDSRGKKYLGDHYTRDRNEDGHDRAESISRSGSADVDEYRDRVEVWDYWLPNENLVITIPAIGDAKPLMVREWQGPERGMYHLLSFNDVPGNIMPLSPAQLWYDIHDLSNRIYRKLARQAARQKENTIVRGSAAADGNRIVNASDGETILTDDPKATMKVTSGGPDPSNLAFFLGNKDLFSWIGGNIDALGGLSPLADTLGQDEMLTQTASQRVEDMGDRCQDHRQAVIEDIGFYTWTDPLREMQLEHQIGNIKIPFVWMPEDREGDFVQYNIEIIPYSAEHQSPVTKVNNIQRVLTNFYAPFMDDMKQQGMVMDWNQLNDIIATNLNVPELRDIVRFTQMTVEDPQAIGQPSRTKPSHTVRTENRISRPGSTRSGKDTAMSKLLMGIGTQPAEQAAIGRPTG